METHTITIVIKRRYWVPSLIAILLLLYRYKLYGNFWIQICLLLVAIKILYDFIHRNDEDYQPWMEN